MGQRQTRRYRQRQTDIEINTETDIYPVVGPAQPNDTQKNKREVRHCSLEEIVDSPHEQGEDKTSYTKHFNGYLDRKRPNERDFRCTGC